MYERRARNARTRYHVASAAAAIALLALGPVLVADAGKAVTWEPDSANLEWGPCPAFMPDDCGIAVLHDDPAQPNAEVFFRLAGNTIAPRHWHTSAERMVLVSGKMQVDYDDQELFVLGPGAYAYGPSRLPQHRCRDPTPRTGGEYRVARRAAARPPGSAVQSPFGLLPG
jgi:hypothetical protein